MLIKGALDAAVPIIGIAQHLNALGHKVTVLCGDCSEDLGGDLTAAGIIVAPLQTRELRSSNDATGLQKTLHWLSFREKCLKYLRQSSSYDFVYVGSADTALSLSGVLPSHNYVLHLRELHDKQPLYMRMLRPIAQKARCVVVPEENRAFIYYDWLDLSEVPEVIPNKPFAHPRERNMDISFLDQSLQVQLRSKKNILYQGHLHLERDLSPLLRAASRLTEYNFVVMGKDQGMLSRFRAICPDIVHVPFVRPPLHLNVTSWAHIGVLVYDFGSLNTIFCAPNKVWEFSGFGIPMLGSANPGLAQSVGAKQAAVLSDFRNDDAVVSAIRKIEGDYGNMQSSARAFYDSADVRDTLSRIVG